MRRQLLALIIAIIVGLVAIVAPLAYYHYYYHPQSTAGAGSSVGLPDGLQMYLNISPDRFVVGGSITIDISIVNPATHNVTIAAAQDWPISGASLGACNTFNYPMGIAIYSGHYMASNITMAGEPLLLYALVPCPMVILYVKSYVFAPYGSPTTQWSDSNGTFYVGSYEIHYASQLSGFWAVPPSGASQFRSFPAGNYTVVGADEWGQMAISHFTVEPAP
ncbi:MAG: hypothetical protein JRM98_03795 [Nitrososphaerota archaeon]|jgi:hypothetical protein|nr:hypothetical protein [Nitrososphaerota archaeon]